MKHKYILILIGLVCMSLSKSYEPVVKYDNARNSYNCGLIGLSNNLLVLNKVNDITAYDLNGGLLNIIKTYDRSRYQVMSVNNSILVMGGPQSNVSFFQFVPMGNLYEIPLNFNLESRNTNEVLLVDSLVFVLTDRFPSSGVNQNTWDRFTPLLYLTKWDKSGNWITSDLSQRRLLFPVEATSFTLLQDSLLFYVNNRINCLNLNEINPQIITSDFNLNPENAMTSTVSSGNMVYTSNSKSIFAFEYKNSTIDVTAEIR